MNPQHQLIETAQTGSVHAFEMLIYALQQQMLSAASGLANYSDEADDIYQEAMMTAFKNIHTYRFESQFSTWLYGIVVNTALNYRRRLNNRLSRQAPAPEDAIEGGHMETYSVPDREAENAQLGDAIHRAMAHLSEQERVAFVLCHQQQLPILEAATVMACTGGAIKSYLFRARDKLRRSLCEHR